MSDGFPYPVDQPGNFAAEGKPDRAAALEAGIREIIGICEQDARDQDHNGKSEGWGKGAKAYAEGRGTACRGITARLRALLPADAPTKETPR